MVGGGINGLCCAWRLARQGAQVTLYERGDLMRETSQASSKLLHGGLRYLENYEFRLVREALRERDSWLSRVPELAEPLELIVPIYKGSRRGRLLVGLGLFIYRLLAGPSRYGRYEWRTTEQLLKADPDLASAGLKGGYAFFDGQMDDYQLGIWVAEQAERAGGTIAPHSEVTRVATDGRLVVNGEEQQFDYVVNVAGPWAESLCRRSNCSLPYSLDLVRGSHLVLNRPCAQAYLLEVVEERRVVFVLPWKGQTLLGTTEVRQSLDEPIECSDAELTYLIEAYNSYMNDAVDGNAVVSRFAGVRPLIKSALNPNRATREYALHCEDRLLTVLGGKWTTSMALARQVAKRIDKAERRAAKA